MPRSTRRRECCAALWGGAFAISPFRPVTTTPARSRGPASGHDLPIGQIQATDATSWSAPEPFFAAVVIFVTPSPTGALSARRR